MGPRMAPLLLDASTRIYEDEDDKPREVGMDGWMDGWIGARFGLLYVYIYFQVRPF